MTNKPESLYIHIPFCDHICKYCDFTKLFYFEKYEKEYLDSLITEIEHYHINRVKTLYFGGGTPTSLSDEGFERILSFATQYLEDDYEFTVEANVENLTESKLSIMKKCGVNRISIGVQSTNDKLLKEIGRNHSFEDVRRVVSLAKAQGFDNINIDLIYGFKHQSARQLKKDLKNFIELDIDHISIYSLIVEKGSIFYSQGVKEQSEGASRRFYEIILKTLRKNGYERYEISNFARNKKYSRHNMTYWKNREYYGCGLGASGFVSGNRYTNTKSLTEYNKHNFVKESEKVSNKDSLEYYLITNFRMEQGFSREEFKQKFGQDFAEMFKDKINKFLLSNLLVITPDRVKLNDDGLLLMDFVILKLI
ncbi:MAG: radical SAM family heme chaperone HemW [Firmicutes bacterium]|nr:radical SAM family heme chaperone HemW [Candidatus Fiminaster equi]